MPVSATEWSASASIAELPDITAATAFAIAIAVFAASAARTLFRGFWSLPLFAMPSVHATRRRVVPI